MAHTFFARVTTVVAAVLICAVLLPGAAGGQTTSDLDAFRERLATFLREIEELHVLMGIHAEGEPGPGEAAAPDLATMSYDDLVVLMMAYPDDPRFWSAPRKLLDILKGVTVSGHSMPGVSMPLPRGRAMGALLARWSDRTARRSRLTDEDVTVLMRAYSTGRPAQQAPRAVLATLQRAYQVDDELISRADVRDLVRRTVPARSATMASDPVVTLTTVAAEAAADPTPCPAGFDYEALWVARDAEMVADIAMSVVPEDALTSPAFIAAAVAWSALKVTLFVVEQIYERWDDCESAQVFAQVDASISSRATQSSVDALLSSVSAAASGVGALQSGINAVHTDVSSLHASVALIPATVTATMAVDSAVMQASLATMQATIGTELTATRSSVTELGGRIDSLAAASASGAVVNDLSTLVNAAVPRAMGPSGPITVYNDFNFGGFGRSFHGNETDANLECLTATFRYNIRSLRVPPGTTVTFYATCNFGGASRTFTATDDDLTDNKIQVNETIAVFPAASMRIEQTQVPLPALIASQAGLDELTEKIEGLDLSAAGALAAKIDSVDNAVSGLSSAMDAPVSTRASQASVDALAASVASVGSSVGAINLSNLDAGVSTRASQSAVDAVQTAVAGVQTAVAGVQGAVSGVQADLTARTASLEATLGTRASQASVDALAASLATVGDSVGGIDLARLDVGVSTRASQAAVEAVQDAVTGVLGELAARATSLDTALGSVGAAVGTRASQASLDQVGAALATRASQGSLDAAADSILAALQQRFDDLAARTAVEPLQLQVVQIANDRVLAYVTEGGRPVSGVTLSRLQVLSSRPGNGTLAVADITAAASVTEVAPGVLEIRTRRGERFDGLIVSVAHGTGPSARAASMVVRDQRGND